MPTNLLRDKYTLVVDTRERLPLTRHFEKQGYFIQEEALVTGDYSVEGFENTIAVERKSQGDLMNCLTHDRQRFERQLKRGLQLEQFCVVVECPLSDIQQGNYRSEMHPNAAIASIRAFERRYRVRFVFCQNPEEAAEVTARFLNAFLKDHEHHKRPFQWE